MIARRITLLLALALGLGVSVPALALTPADIEILKARAQRHDAAAQVELGDAYLNGDGALAADPHAAANWFEQAALEGDDYAQEMLAKLYEDGKGVERNLKLAADWREKAAKRGNSHAQFLLGQMYQEGRGVTQDRHRARYWLKRAAIEGDEEAAAVVRALNRDSDEREHGRGAGGLSWSALESYDVGVHLIELIDRLGYRMREDFAHHRPHLLKLATDGDPEAEFRLALRYEHGDGVSANRDVALKWYRMAASHGHEGAKAALKELTKAPSRPRAKP